jgi:hypothetical protein
VQVASYGTYIALDIASYGCTRDDLVAAAKGSTGWDKGYLDSSFELKRSFGGGVKISINADRDQVCERVVVGQRVVDAVPAHVVDVVEWKCGDSLLKGTAGGEA